MQDKNGKDIKDYVKQTQEKVSKQTLIFLIIYDITRNGKIDNRDKETEMYNKFFVLNELCNLI